MVYKYDMEYCEGTKDGPHPGVWFYRPEKEIDDGDFHRKLVRLGQCPVCVILRHVVLIKNTDDSGRDGVITLAKEEGRLEIKK